MLTKFLFTALLSALFLAACATPEPVPNTGPTKTPSTVAPANTPALASASPAAKATPQENTDFLIQPGYKIGKIALDMERPQVHAALGRPLVSYPLNDVVIDAWGSNESDNLVEVAYRNNKVAQVKVTSPRFVTKEGISTQNTRAEIQRAYPKLTQTATQPAGEGEESETNYFEDQVLGVSFAFLKDKCFTVAVHKPGTTAIRPQPGG